MKKRIFSILLCIAVCMAMMPLGVYGSIYYITIGGEAIKINTEEKVEYDITNNIKIKKEGGYVKYNGKTYTLTLKDAEINGNISFSSESYTIIVEGENTINAGNRTGIDASGSLTFKGGGKLTVTGSTGIKCSGSNTKDITFNNVEIEVTGTNQNGLYWKTGNVNIINSRITAATNGGAGYAGIIADGGHIIAADAVDEKGEPIKTDNNGIISKQVFTGTIDNKFDKYAIWVAGKQVTSRNADDVLGDKTGSVSYDFKAKTLTLNNAKISGSYSQPDRYTAHENWGAITWISDTGNQYLRLMLEGENTVTNNTLDGICAKGPFDIAGDGKLTVVGKENGIYTGGKIIIAAGGGIDVTGEKSGISAAQKVNIESYVKATGKSEAGISSGRAVYISGKVEAKGFSSTAISAAGGIGCSTEEIELENGTLTDENTLKVKNDNDNKGYAAISPVNYTLYYDAAKGKMYKSYDNGTFSNEYTKGNWSSSKSKGSNKYDVLKLNNFEFETAAGTGLKIIGIDDNETFTIKGTGENHISVSGNNGYGIYTDGSLNFDGGRMYINIEDYADAEGAVYAGGDINLTDCELYDGGMLLNGDIERINPKGISAGGAFVIENADVRTNCIEAEGGISAREYMQINYLTVTGKKGTSVTKVEAARSEHLLHIYGRLIAKFDANGGKWSDINDTTKSVPVSLDGNRYIILPEEDPVREGYNFTGWLYKDGNKLSEKTKYEISEEKENLLPKSSDFEELGVCYVFYAHWKKLCKEHTFGSWTVTKQPTATEKGEKTRICSVCEYKETAEIPATGGSTSGGGAVIPPAADEDIKTTTDSTTSEKTTGTTVKDSKTETVKDEQGEDISKITAKVSDKVADKLVDEAVSSKSDNVEITVKSNDGNKAGQTEIEIPKKAIDSIAKNTDADLVIKTGNGQIAIDNKALGTIAEAAEGDTLRIIVTANMKLKESQKPVADAIGNTGVIFDVAAYIGNTRIYDLKDGKAEILLPVPENLKDKDIAVIYISDKGICEIVNHTAETVGTDNFAIFTASQFANYAIVEKADAEKIIEKQNADKINSLIREAKLKATTSKTAKKSIKVKIGEAKNSNSLIKEAKAMGYTVKYKFYKSTRKASKYIALKTKDTDTYINTAGKKGTKYYYKAKVLVYDGKTLIAQTELKQCRYGVRSWNK